MYVLFKQQLVQRDGQLRKVRTLGIYGQAREGWKAGHHRYSFYFTKMPGQEVSGIGDGDKRQMFKSGLGSTIRSSVPEGASHRHIVLKVGYQ